MIIDGMVDGDRVNKALFGLGRLARLTRGTGGLNIDAIARKLLDALPTNTEALDT